LIKVDRVVFVHRCRHTNQLNELNIQSATGRLESCCRLDFWYPVVYCVCIFHCCKNCMLKQCVRTTVVCIRKWKLRKLRRWNWCQFYSMPVCSVCSLVITTF